MDGLLGGFSALMSPDLWALMLVGVVVGTSSVRFLA